MKFNETSKEEVRTNYENAPAHKIKTPELALYSLVCNSIIEDQFYRAKGKQLEEIKQLVIQSDPEFVHKLARYARKEMNLRSVPVVLAVMLAIHTRYPQRAAAVHDVIQRADEITEVLSYFGSVNPHATKTKPLAKCPKAILKGIKQVFESGRFDEYQFAKYNRATAVKLRDALFLSHPDPRVHAVSDNADQKALFTKISEDSLDVPYTWETELSKGGNRTETWERLIDSKKVGYMAMLRNLRNIAKANVSDEHIQKVADFIGSDVVIKAKQFPFRFWSAYRELKSEANTAKIRTLIEGVEQAIVKSVRSYPKFKDNVLIACDTSGSMNSRTISPKSSIRLIEVGLVFGALLAQALPNAIVGQFGAGWLTWNEQSGSVLQTAETFIGDQNRAGHATNGHLAIDYLIQNKIMVDQVFMFTDMQLWNSGGYGYNRSSGDQPISVMWPEYLKINPNAKLWMFDLAGYGDTPLRLDGAVNFVSGWSDKVFEAAEYIRNGGTIVDKIRAY